MSQLFMPGTQLQSSLFLKSNGTGFKFFVETAAVQERPKLVRRIRGCGGLIVSSAREADILLAENNTKEALEILDAWSADKVVLSTRWVGRCIESNEFLGKEQNWGEFFLNRDELRECCIDIDEEYQDTKDLDDDGSNETSKPIRRKRKATTTVSSNDSHAGKTPISSSSTVRLETPLTKKRKVVSHHTKDSNEVENHTIMPLYQAGMSTSSPISPVEVSSSPFSTQQMQAVLQQQASIINYLSGLFQQSSQQNIFASSVGSAINPMNTTPIVQLQGLSSAPQQFAIPQQMQLNPAAFTPQHAKAVEGLANIISQAQFGSGTISIPYQQNSQTTSSRVTPEDAELASEDHSTHSEGEVEVTVLDRKQKRKARRNSTSSLDDGAIQTAIRSNPPRVWPKPNVPSVKNGIFTDDRGLPSKFFVTLDLRIRKELLKIIRKHGGDIVLRMEDADYIILNNRSPQFQQCLQLLPLDKIALSPTWLQECDKTGAVAGLAGHMIDIDSGHGPGAIRKKQVSSARKSKAKLVDNDCESEEGAPDPPTTSQASVRTPETKSLPKKLFEDVGRRSRSPLPFPSSPSSSSPPPPTTIIPTDGHRIAFTEKDREWFFRYARFKLQREPKMSMMQLMKSVGHKAPYHSAQSWGTTARVKWRDEMDAFEREIRCQQPRVISPTNSQRLMQGSQELPKSPSGPGVVCDGTPSKASAAAVLDMNALEHFDARPPDGGSSGNRADSLPIQGKGFEPFAPQSNTNPLLLGQTKEGVIPQLQGQVINVDEFDD
ncbi:hypothetical protein BU17DRAFT_84081 [Hysterangium stoloniferum]|nr:hypothetical protein BU17DRAFT_84081 [Hysterangium stoloniferum]